MQVYLAVTPDNYHAATPYGYRLAHLAYRIAKDGHLARQAISKGTRGGLLTITDEGFPVLSKEMQETLCHEILKECTQRGYEGVVADFANAPVAGRADFVQALATLLNNNSRRFYITQNEGHRIGSATILICTAMSGGNFTVMLREMLRAFGQRRIALDIARLMMDFTLPSPKGIGTTLSKQALNALKEQYMPAIFYSSDLCAKYFTYQKGGQTHFVLFDDAETIKQKMIIGQKLGIATAIMQYGEVSELLPEIKGMRKAK